jgi:hypothetical protein
LATTGAAGAAARPRGQEDHVGALEQLLDLVLLVEGGLVADARVGAGAETAGHLAADVQRQVRVRRLQRLKVGVDRHELHAGQLRLDHPVDGVDARATDAHDPEDGLVGARHDGLPGRGGIRRRLVAAVAGPHLEAGATHEALQALVVDLDLGVRDRLGRSRLGDRLGSRDRLRHGVGRGLGDRFRGGLGDRLGERRLLDRLLDRDAAAVLGRDLDLLWSDRLLGRAEKIGEGALAHAGALLTSHG